MEPNPGKRKNNRGPAIEPGGQVNESKKSSGPGEPEIESKKPPGPGELEIESKKPPDPGKLEIESKKLSGPGEPVKESEKPHSPGELVKESEKPPGPGEPVKECEEPSGPGEQAIESEKPPGTGEPEKKNKKTSGSGGQENVRKMPDRKQPPLWKDLLGLIIKAAVVAGFIYVVFTFVFGLTEGDGMMAPSIKAGDLILYYRLDKACVAGDVVVYQANGGDVSEYRVIAQAGDTVDIKDGSLVINGYPQNESYLYGVTTDAWDEGISFPVTVGQDEVFLLCDNRTEGVDSRIFGSVKTGELMGKAVTVIRRRSI